MPIITGAITVADLLDGVTGPSVVFSNETHTFVAEADGEILAGELAAFSTDVRVYVGSEQYSYVTTTPAAGEFSIGTFTYTPSGTDITATATDEGDHANITIADAGGSSTGFDDAGTAIDSMSITVPITVNIAGTSITVNRLVSLTKAKGGDAKVVRLTASRQTFEYAFGAATPKDNALITDAVSVLFDLTSINFGADTSTASWSYSVQGGTFNTIDADAGTVDSDTFGMKVTPAQFDHAIDEGTEATYVTYRATRDSRFDQITLFKLTDAEGGYSIVIEIIGGVSVFRNDPAYVSTDASTYCDLMARVFRGGIELTTGLTYQWKKNGTNLTNSDLDPGQPANYGVTMDRIRVGAQDISDNGSELFECEVDTG